eukprot:XP_011444675.1 PREDICTED: glutathione S-transferase A [Crassostrea gigas]
MHEAAANMQQKLILDLLYYFFQTKEEDRKEEEVAKKVEAAIEELDRWEAYLGETKAFVAGPDFSMADVWFYPIIAQSIRMGLDLGKFPNMKAYYDKVTARPSVQKSWPPHWKEEPPMISPFKGRI